MSVTLSMKQMQYVLASLPNPTHTLFKEYAKDVIMSVPPADSFFTLISEANMPTSFPVSNPLRLRFVLNVKSSNMPYWECTTKIIIEPSKNQ